MGATPPPCGSVRGIWCLEMEELKATSIKGMLSTLELHTPLTSLRLYSSFFLNLNFLAISGSAEPPGCTHSGASGGAHEPEQRLVLSKIVNKGLLLN